VNTQTNTTAAVIEFDEAVLELQVHRLIELDAKIKAAQDARAELAAEIVDAVDAHDGTVTVDGIKVTVVRAVRRVIDIAKLEEIASRRLFAKLTKRVVDIGAYDAHLAAGTTGIEAVEEIVEHVESKPSLRITK
jgi:hypothetical protein